MNRAKITGRNSLRLLWKLLIGAGLLFIIVISVAIPGAKDFPRTIYNYSRRSPNIIMFRLGKKEQVEGTVAFFRDQFPWAEHEFSSITFKPPFPNNFAQNPEEGLRQWGQLNNSMWSIPNQYPKVVDYYYSEAHSARNEFRCANTMLQMAQGEKPVKIDCIEIGRGWHFDYEGKQDDVHEAMSILEHGF